MPECFICNENCVIFNKYQLIGIGQNTNIGAILYETIKIQEMSRKIVKFSKRYVNIFGIMLDSLQY